MAGEIDRLEIKIGADASEASQKINDLASSLTRLAAPAGTAASSLKELATSLSSFKSGKNITKLNDSIDIISQAVEKINGIQVTADMERLVDTFAGLELITESMKGLKVNKSFETNLESLSAAIKQLNEIGSNTGFADGVTGIEQALERLNNIEIGQGFINLSQATASFERSIASMNEFRLDSSFSESVARVARAAEILNDVDFSGMRRMQDVLANMPEGVQISFGSMSNAPDLTEISNTLNGIRDSLSELSGASDEASESMDREAESTERAGNAAQRTTAPIGELGDLFDKIANGSLKVVGASIKAIIAPIQAVGNKFSAAASKAGQFLSSIKRIAMYRAVRTAIKAITEGFAEGRKNLYYYSQAVGTDFAPSMDKAATAALYLKNSIGAATAPLTNYLVPMIDKAVDHIVELINKFNELTAVLTGASTWTRAIKYPTTWQEELDDANASAKKLKSTMLGFDELNVIEPNTPSAKASKLDMDDYSKMFEEMQTSATWKDKVPEILLPAKLAWDAEGDNTIQTIKKTWEEIKGLIDSVGESFRTVWMNGTGQQTLETVLQIVQNIVGTFGALAKGIRKAWDEGGKGTAIIQSVWNIANNLLTVFRDIWASIREWAEGLDWNPLLTALGSLFDAVDRFTNPESGAAKFLRYLYRDILLPIGKWIVETGIPKVVGFATAIVNLATTISNNLYPVWKWIDENLLKPGGTFAGSMISVTIDALTELINLLDKLANGDWDFSDNWLVGFGYDLGSGKENYGDLWESGVKDIFPELFNGGGNSAQKSLMGFGDSVYNWLHPNLDEEGILSDKVFEGYNSEAGKLLSQSLNSDDIEKPHFFKEYFENFNIGVDSIIGKIGELKTQWDAFWQSSTEFWGEVGAAFFGFFEKVNTTLAGIPTTINGAINKFITKTVPEFGKKLVSAFTSAITNVTNLWQSGWKSISNFVSITISDIVGWWESGWTSISNFVSTTWLTITSTISGYAESVISTFGGIKENVLTTWGTITSTLSDALSWESLKGFVGDYSAKFLSVFDDMKTKAMNFFGDLDIFKKAGQFRDDILDFFGGILGKDEMSGVRGKFNEIKNTIVGAFGTIFNNLKEPINNILNGIDTLVHGAIDAIGGILNGLTSGISGAAKDALQKFLGINLDDITWDIEYPTIPRLAQGGIPDEGQLFLAREAGAELVGQYGSHTAVMNNQQIVQAVSDGVYRAVSAAMQKQTGENRTIENHIYLDRQELTSQINQQNLANGVDVFGAVVYT